VNAPQHILARCHITWVYPFLGAEKDFLDQFDNLSHELFALFREENVFLPFIILSPPALDEPQCLYGEKMSRGRGFVPVGIVGKRLLRLSFLIPYEDKVRKMFGLSVANDMSGL